jgi:release factor glutamine methyltransferase
MKPNVSPQQDLTKPDLDPKSLLQAVQLQLRNLTESPYLDGVVLLSHITECTKSKILANPNLALTAKQSAQLDLALKNLRSGTALPYVLGQWEFFNLSFKVTPDVLIPRPETEGLVEIALKWLEMNPDKQTCLEIGTGSGCIAILLAKSIPGLKVIATDISPAALRVAQENAAAHQIKGQIKFLERDLLAGISKKSDLLIANLPYIPTAKLLNLAVYQSEPRLALDGGPDGLHYIKEVLKSAKDHLNPGGAILLELDEDCGSSALTLAKDLFPGLPMKLSQDYSGQDRYLFIQI